MKKTVLVLMIGVLLIGVNVFAADGDLSVMGTLGVGTDTPSAKLDVRGDAVFNQDGGDYDFRIESDTYANMFKVDAGSDTVSMGDVVPYNKLGSRVLSVTKSVGGTSSTVAAGYFEMTMTPTSGKNHVRGLQGISRPQGTVWDGNEWGNSTAKGLSFGLVFEQDKWPTPSGSTTLDAIGIDSTITVMDTLTTVAEMIGINVAFNAISTAAGTEVHNVGNYYGIKVNGPNFGKTSTGVDFYGIHIANSGSSMAYTNSYGLYLAKQTRGTNDYGIVLDGDGAGADIVFGPNQEAKIYSNSGEIYVKDGANNVTQISPHDPETGEWIFYSKNVKTGRVVRVDMEQLVKDMEKLTGKTYMVETFEEIK